MSRHITPAALWAFAKIYFTSNSQCGAGLGCKVERIWVWEEGKGRSGSLRLFLLFTIDLCGSSPAKLLLPANHPERETFPLLVLPISFSKLVAKVALNPPQKIRKRKEKEIKSRQWVRFIKFLSGSVNYSFFNNRLLFWAISQCFRERETKLYLWHISNTELFIFVLACS